MEAIPPTFLQLALGTIATRPYVFLFLVAFLFVALPAWGWRRTAIFIFLGVSLAWAAEYSSIHNGFPFGYYEYFSLPTQQKELWLAGVPCMSSLSFVFLTFAGLQTARLLLDPLQRGSLGFWDLRWSQPSLTGSTSVRAWLLGGLLTMGLDVVIDPVTLHGDKWFLGQLYHYPQGGPYFGIPLSNFAGWALLAWTILGVFLLLEKTILRKACGTWRASPYEAVLGAGLFAGILAFNLGVTFAIGQVLLAWVGCLWALIFLLPIFLRLQRFYRPTLPDWE